MARDVVYSLCGQILANLNTYALRRVLDVEEFEGCKRHIALLAAAGIAFAYPLKLHKLFSELMSNLSGKDKKEYQRVRQDWLSTFHSRIGGADPWRFMGEERGSFYEVVELQKEV